MNILKSIGAVLAGFFTVFILSTITDLVLQFLGVIPSIGPLFDTPLLLLALFYRTLYTILGGYFTGKLAPSRPMRHALILAIIGAVVGSIGAYVARDLGPAWYSIGIVVLSIPAIWLGAKLSIRRLNKN